MRIIHSQGFPDDERRQTRPVIYSNLVVAFKVLLDIMHSEQIEYEHEKTKVIYRFGRLGLISIWTDVDLSLGIGGPHRKHGS